MKQVVPTIPGLFTLTKCIVSFFFLVSYHLPLYMSPKYFKISPYFLRALVRPEKAISSSHRPASESIVKTLRCNSGDNETSS